MSGKKAIKVIKKEQRTKPSATVKRANSARETAREMVQNVTSWVNEFQQKRRTDTSDALKSLLQKTPRPSEA